MNKTKTGVPYQLAYQMPRSEFFNCSLPSNQKIFLKVSNNQNNILTNK